MKRMKVELTILPLENKQHALRLLLSDGAEVFINDPEHANNFLKCYFSWNNEDIKEYWGV
jgi:hypothetical protein